LNDRFDEHLDRALVELTPADRDAAMRVLEKLAGTALDSHPTNGPSLAELAWRMYDARKDRRHYFSEDLFSDPAWDMLLLLYCSESKAEAISVSALCTSTGLPQTSALRWISVLEGRRLVYREPHPTDGRSSVVRLTEESRLSMNQYFQRVRERYLR
jgi:DNA-binding MarR family transcriptional regulator